LPCARAPACRSSRGRRHGRHTRGVVVSFGPDLLHAEGPHATPKAQMQPRHAQCSTQGMTSMRSLAIPWILAAVSGLGCAKAPSQPAAQPTATYAGSRAAALGQPELQAPSEAAPPVPDVTPTCADAIPGDGTAPAGPPSAAIDPPAPGALIAVRPDGTLVAAEDIPVPSPTIAHAGCLPQRH
jgi:hypothetical protein